MDLMFIVMQVCLMVCFEFKIELPGGAVWSHANIASVSTGRAHSGDLASLPLQAQKR